MTREAFDATIQKLTEFYRGRGGERVTGMIADTWYQMFALQEAHLLARTIDKHIQTSKTNLMPAPGDLREVMEDIREADEFAEKRAGYQPPPVVADGMTGRQEWAFNAAITVAVLDLHSARHPQAVVRRDAEGRVCPEYNDAAGHPTMEQWMHMGCPRTWSSLVDAYMDGLAGVWYSGTAAIVAFQREYLAQLQAMIRAIEMPTEQMKAVA